MPELPEVETVVRDLRPLLVGRTIRSVRVGVNPLRTPWLAEWNANVIGRTFTALERRGKWMRALLDDAAFLVLHLGMTGQLRLFANNAPEEDHIHWTLALDAEKELRFRDIRRFGSVTYHPRGYDWTANLGPEPFDLTPLGWRASLTTTRPIKAALLDQTLVAGVGNIYADEALFTARLAPTRPTNTLSPAEAETLRLALVAVLTKAIDGRGSTIRNYVGGSGLQGTHQEQLAVYGRTGEPCLVCGTPIACVRLAGRSTHFCPRCQPT